MSMRFCAERLKLPLRSLVASVVTFGVQATRPWRSAITGVLKSQEDFYVRLHAQLLRCDPLELGLSDHKSLARDLETLRSRVACEGLAFLTKTLPKLGKALDRGLVSGSFNLPNGFKPAKGTNTPAFLQAYFKEVFDNTGLLLELASVVAIRHLRQVLYFAYKLEMPYTADETSRVIETFIATDEAISPLDDPLARELISLAKIITWKVFDGFNHKNIRPQHGPGAVATGERMEGKWNFHRLFNSIHQVFPYYNYYVVGGARELADRLDWYKSLQRFESGIAKVVLVPKDSRGPRLISCEPLEYQWIQQGLGRKLANHLESVSTLTKGQVNFTDQEINRGIAETSSASQQYSTLDLKDASDRVSLDVVRDVFERTPDLLRALEAVRSTDTKLPDGRTIRLKKYAPMGSAVCFPVEAYIFWAIIVSAVVHGKNLPLRVVAKEIFVYGDDIVVPTDWALLSIQGLEAVGLKVNIDKSCITGNFRESCGLDAFKGYEVTPIRLRKQWSGRDSDGTALASYVSIANKMAAGMYYPVADLLWKEIEALYGKIPYGTFRSSYPCRIVESADRAEALNAPKFKRRFSTNFQRLEYRVPILSLRKRRTSLDDWTRLLRNVVSPPIGDPSDIVLPLSMKIKRGWASVT